MSNRRYSIYLAALFAVLTTLFAGCTPDPVIGNQDFRFNASIEQIDDQNGTKVRLVDEHWIYWEDYDQINLASNLTSSESYSAADNYADLINASGEDWEEYNGVFITTLPNNSEYFCGLFPRNDNNLIYSTGGNDFYAKIHLAETQPLRSDITFARNVFPMVAWYGGSWNSDPYTPYNLDFHSLAGIVRLQFFNNAASKTLHHIEVRSLNGQQLCGGFQVIDFRTFENVRLEPMANTAANQTITLSCGDGLELGSGDLKSFYMIMPATKTMHDSTVHRLEVKLVATDGTSCTRNMTTYVRRNGITYMRALGIDEWVASGNGTSSPGLVGNGTEGRPFKIYSVEELVYLREAFKTSPVKINNQLVTSDTYFRIMRSNLKLNTTNWTSGIPDFVGHLEYYGTNTSNAVIVNNSRFPVFASVADGGEVRGITVARDTNDAFALSFDFSFLCNTNHGTLRDCIIRGTYNTATSNNGGLGGICAYNYGTLRACGCTATLNCEDGFVGGICYKNYSGGQIDECYGATAMSIASAASAAGICYENQSGGEVKNSYFACRIIGTSIPWGGIVYNNSGTVEHCYASETAILNGSASVGGIVNNNLSGGVVNYCWAEATMRGTPVGGIAATAATGSRIVNSFCDQSLMVITVASSAANDYGGGIVGQLNGGTVENSFVHISSLSKAAGSGVVGGIAGLVGSASGTQIINSYVYEEDAANHYIYGAMPTPPASPVFTGCHLVGGTGTIAGVTNCAISADVNIMNANLEVVKVALNVGVTGDYKSWEKASANGYVTVPTLTSYSSK